MCGKQNVRVALAGLRHTGMRPSKRCEGDGLTPSVLQLTASTLTNYSSSWSRHTHFLSVCEKKDRERARWGSKRMGEEKEKERANENGRRG